MAWFADLAGKAESLLNNLDEQTGAAIRNHKVKNPKQDKTNYPDSNWGQRNRRPMVRNSRKPTSVIETRVSHSPPRKLSQHHNSHSTMKEIPVEKNVSRAKKAPPKTKVPQFHLNNCPKTLVDDVKGDIEVMDHIGLKQRRHSLSAPLEEINSSSTICMQNLTVENAMLKNELNVMNRELSQILEKLRKAEDGNDVDKRKELSKVGTELENTELKNHKLNLDKESLLSQLDMLKEKIKEIASLEIDYQGEKNKLVTENSMLKDAHHYLEEKVNELNKKKEETKSAQHKLETELRHAQSTISELQSNLDKSNGECQRLEKEWETYKLRVKSMLYAKDNEIKSLQVGLNVTEDTKLLVEQLDTLKEERDELSEAIAKVRTESEAMRSYLVIVENRHTAAERAVTALRDAMKEERAARNKAENQFYSVSKEFKILQNETGQTIASLRNALRDKEAELHNVRETVSSVKTSDTSALNVADYDSTQSSIANEKIHYLTEALVQKQGKVDKLLAENNMLKIQLDKLESKLKLEISNRNAMRNTHSIVNVQGGDARSRRTPPDSLLAVVSYRMAAVIRRHPVLRIFIVMYMICLHFWVLTVLLTSTPAENIIPRMARK